MTFDCPRCSSPADETFYGPCPSCRDALVTTYAGAARAVGTAAYVPKMNVTPNQVATKN